MIKVLVILSILCGTLADDAEDARPLVDANTGNFSHSVYNGSPLNEIQFPGYILGGRLLEVFQNKILQPGNKT